MVTLRTCIVQDGMDAARVVIGILRDVVNLPANGNPEIILSVMLGDFGECVHRQIGSLCIPNLGVFLHVGHFGSCTANNIP